MLGGRRPSPAAVPVAASERSRPAPSAAPEGRRDETPLMPKAVLPGSCFPLQDLDSNLRRAEFDFKRALFLH